MKTKTLKIFLFFTLLLSFIPFEPTTAQTLPDLVLNRFVITRLEWHQVPDCDHNACQNLAWKALIEYTFMVQNRGLAPAQIPNGNFESSAIQVSLFHQNDNVLVAQIFNWESVPNPLDVGAAAQLYGRMYISDNPQLLKPYDMYRLCLTITDKASDNQNWNLVESNVNNNTLCSDFRMDLVTHVLPNPKVVSLNTPALVQRNVDRSADFQIIYTVQNTPRQVYVSNFGYRLELIGNETINVFCPGNISPGLHGQEMQSLACAIHLPPGTSAARYTIRAIVDKGNRVAESNERDNILEKQIDIL